MVLEIKKSCYTSIAYFAECLVMRKNIYFVRIQNHQYFYTIYHIIFKKKNTTHREKNWKSRSLLVQATCEIIQMYYWLWGRYSWGDELSKSTSKVNKFVHINIVT